MKQRLGLHSVLLVMLAFGASACGGGDGASADHDGSGTGGVAGGSGGLGGSAADDAGGAGGAPTAGGAGTGGATTDCESDPLCCPTAQPHHGSSCAKTVACSYVRDDCTPSVTVEANCVDGSWESPAPASCGLSPNAACDPLGTWNVTTQETLVYGEHGSIAPPLSFGLSKKDNVVFSTLGGITVSSDGCSITGKASDTASVPGAPDGWTTTVIEKLTLTVVGAGGATGTYTSTCEGECGWLETVAVTGVKVSP